MTVEIAAPRNMKTFLIIWLGQLISMLGSGLTSFALGVWIYDQTKQATPFAITVFLGNLPRILLSPLAGSLADRWNRRWLMILSDSANALATLAVLALNATVGLQVWHIYLIAFFGSVFSAFQEPAYMASVTMIVPKDQLARASGLAQMGQALEMLVAPFIAGLLFGLIGLNGIVTIDFVTFFFAIGALMLVRIPQPPAPEVVKGAGGQVWQDAVFGWKYLRARAGLFGLLWYYALVNFLLNFASVLLLPLILSFSNSAGLGAAQMIAALGMLAGSIVLSAWGGPKKRRIPSVIGFIILAAVGLGWVGLRPHLFFPAAGMFTMLFNIPIASGISQAVFQSKIAANVQGRVFAIRSMISRSMMPLATLSAGPLADWIFEPLMRPGGALEKSALAGLIGAGEGRGIGLMFLISGITLVVASVLAWANPRIRLVEDELPDEVNEG